ncbi:MAG: protein kinase [Myxococcales bacterium]|nr:protein kinase [Myxococcales bacterium]
MPTEPKNPTQRETIREAAPVGLVMPQAGALIDGVYRVEHELGRGAYGLVMLANDEVLDRQVALKFLHPMLTEEAQQRSRFLTEARAMARIRHPNVVGIHSVGQWQSTPYLVMEYVQGPTLQDYLELHAFALQPDDAMGLFDQMCRGVQAIHEAGATHNDLKPSNMIIGPASRLVITDFGLAEWVRDRGMRRGGTIGFLAPEVAYGDFVPQHQRTAADVYSLGVIAFILFTGTMPFTGDAIDEVLEQQLTELQRRPSEARAGVPPQLDAPIARALAWNPAERTATVAELRSACADALAQDRSATPSPQRVLVIEDDVVLHPWLEAALLSALPAASVECFETPSAALASIDEHPPNLVITDLRLPGMDGFEVVRQLRARPHTQYVPIVAITAAGTPEDWERLTTLGADGFLAKPFESSTLRAVVRRMLARER